MAPRLALVGLAALVLVVAGGCGSSRRESRKNAVNDYITHVNAAERGLLGQVGEIDIALSRFSVAHNSPAEIAALARAQRELSDAVRRVRAIPAPPEARALHAGIVGLLSNEESVARELVQASRFRPRFDAALLPLPDAASRLGRDLAAVQRSAKAAKPVATAPTGLQLWTAAGCGACHTLAAAGSNGSSGPDLDHVRPSRALIVSQVRSGGRGMPSYGGSLSNAELSTLASYVAAASRGVAPPTSSIPTSVTVENAALFAAYAAAFARYHRALEPVAKAVSHLTAPPVLEPGLAAERRALARSLVLTTKIENAFSHHRPAAANTAIKSLFGTVAGASAANVRREQNAATRAYDARLQRIKKLTTRIAVEQQALLATVG